MNCDIIRVCPSNLKLFNYPKRIPEGIFKKRDEILEKIGDRYNKHKLGINPDTDRNININGRLYNKLKQEFIINEYWHSFERIYLGDIEFINYNDYNKETLKLNKDIDDKNLEITNENNEIKRVTEKINKLNNWNDYIDYEGKNYGLSKYYNGIHRENNCMGEIVLKNKYTKLYSNDRPFMCVERETTYYNYECVECHCKYTVAGETDSSISGPNYYKSYDKPKYS
jgi:hypothetical protein